MTVERIFDELGHFKRYQACLYFAAVFQSIACGIHYLASVFLVETPNFVCGVPGNITDVLYGNLTGSSLEDFLPGFKSGSGPLVVRTTEGEQWELSRCRCALRLNPSDFTYVFDGNKTVKDCDGNFAYDHTEIYQSIVTDWDLVCEKEWLAKLCQPTFMLGVLVGALVFGDVADRVGRVRVLMFTSLCQFGLGVAVAFTGNYYFFVVLRFLLAMVSSGYLVVVFVYVTEFTGIKVRTWTSMHVHAAFAVGVMIVALVGYLVRVWWIYQIILSLCTSPFLLFCWRFPETPFYLHSLGNLVHWQLGLLCLLIGFCQPASDCAVIGFLPGAVELPSYLVGCYAMDRIGRKKTCAPSLLLAGVACMLTIVVPTVRTFS